MIRVTRIVARRADGCELPTGAIRFYPQSLDGWLLCTGPTVMGRQVGIISRGTETFEEAEAVCKRYEAGPASPWLAWDNTTGEWK